VAFACSPLPREHMCFVPISLMGSEPLSVTCLLRRGLIKAAPAQGDEAHKDQTNNSNDCTGISKMKLTGKKNCISPTARTQNPFSALDQLHGGQKVSALAKASHHRRRVNKRGSGRGRAAEPLTRVSDIKEQKPPDQTLRQTIILCLATPAHHRIRGPRQESRSETRWHS